MNMHHAEELNEAYHLGVMESLGGDKRWGVSLAHYSSFLGDQHHMFLGLTAFAFSSFVIDVWLKDRFIAFHAGIAYYWYVCRNLALAIPS